MAYRKVDAFCSFDVEHDGPQPLQHSMRSLGIALFSDCQGLVDTFYVNLQPRAHCVVDPHTKQNFWDKWPDKWAAVQHNALPAPQAMAELSQWLTRHSYHFNLKWVARPANCDWMWLKTYYEQYGPPQKFNIGWTCFDLSSMIWTYEQQHQIRNHQAFMTELSEGHPYTHHALDDAKCQGVMYMNLRKRLLAR